MFSYPRRIIQCAFGCKVELVFLLYSLGCALPQPGNSAALRAKACAYHLNFGQGICSRLKQLPEQRYHVNHLAGNIALVSEALLTLLSAFVAILAGPCCDKYGFKGPLAVTTVGAGVTTLCCMLVALLGPKSSMAFDVFAVLPQGLSGGLVLTRACCYFIITKEINIKFVRTLRFFILDMVGTLGKFGGVVLGWILNETLGYLPVLFIACAFQVALFLILLTDQELKQTVQSPDSALKKLSTVFTMANAQEAFNIFDSSRRHDVNVVLKKLFMLLAVISLMNMGPEEILQPFTRVAYGWSIRTYSFVSGMGNVLVAVAGIVVVVVLKLICSTEVHLIYLGVEFGAIRNAVVGFAVIPLAFFLSYLPAVPQGAGPAGVKAYFAKLAPADETGKFLIFVTSYESVVGVAARVVYSSAFNSTVSIHQGLLFFLSAALIMPAIFLIKAIASLAPQTESSTSASSLGSGPDHGAPRGIAEGPEGQEEEAPGSPLRDASAWVESLQETLKSYSDRLKDDREAKKAEEKV